MKRNEHSVVKWLRNGFCLMLAAGMVACATETAETTVGEEVVDTDVTEVGADTWDANEFNTTFAATGDYGVWDENDDGNLDEYEYNGGFFDIWDVNDDNLLDEMEWNTASKDYGLLDENWADWDTSADGTLDENEFNASFANSNYYNEWDVDGDKLINDREFSDGVFNVWDDNRDGVLDDREYGAYNTYFGR
ncbi:hypothetical protein CLV24_10812 [Pontibacter ummariensis]|uniref:EF hand n=1 Tax=Pontibacter ummariensis TaxID=1610492 RepID=A0A239FIJ4_9BACT|nr:hypothetical protein [Pontibacter ummariensis]PRY12269.1 hypothetical protein CLV24_10812 [Pontibacter ummariensis]SNS55874.1 hypothetical protein SAMN06296052_108173 [Pontibacter ummariensis]